MPKQGKRGGCCGSVFLMVKSTFTNMTDIIRAYSAQTCSSRSVRQRNAMSMCKKLLCACRLGKDHPVNAKHEPLLFNDDNEPIHGLKRCKNCGLCETYWIRWPKCESDIKADMFAVIMNRWIPQKYCDTRSEAEAYRNYCALNYQGTFEVRRVSMDYPRRFAQALEASRER